MTPKTRMEELIEHGASITYTTGPVSSLTLAGALWLTGPKRFRWCAIFPEHQGHIHELQYTKVTLDNDGRDVLFYRDGKLVAGVFPYEESSADLNEVRESLAAWRAGLQTYNNQAQFEEFLREA